MRVPRKTPDLPSTLKKLFDRAGHPGGPTPEALFRSPRPAAGASAETASPEAPAAPGESLPSADGGLIKPWALKVGRWIQRRTREQAVAGVDIGSSAVKVVQMIRDDDRMQLGGCGVEELPRSPAQGPEWERAVEDALLKLRKRGLVRGSVVLGFYHFDTVVEAIRLSKMPAGELEQAVIWEVKERLSLSPEKTVIRHVVTGETTADGQEQLDLLVVASPRQELMNHWRLLSNLGFRVTAIEPTSLAPYYCLAAQNLWKSSEVVGILEIGCRFSHLCFVRNGAVRFSRSFQIAGDAFTRAVADYIQIDYDKAEEIKRQYGMSQMALEEDRLQTGHEADDRVRASHALGLFLEKLVAEIEQSYRYFAYELGGTEGQKMDRLLLTGGGVLKNLQDFLGSRLGVPVSVADPFHFFQRVGYGGKPEWNSRLAVPLGLALRPVR